MYQDEVFCSSLASSKKNTSKFYNSKFVLVPRNNIIHQSITICTGSVVHLGLLTFPGM